MRYTLRYAVLLLGIGTTVAIGWPVGAQELKQQGIGLYMAVIGKPTAIHVGQPVWVPVKLRESVFFKDVIQTQADSRAKALFEDDSILTVGENSRVEVNEFVYDPANNQRSTVLRLLQGKARALVGKFFAGLGSKFEVHTPTAVATARGTYFVVWIEEKASQKVGMNETGTVRPVSFQGIEVAELQAGGTGVANIGSSGDVAFTSGGQTVLVPPGTFSFAPPGAPPFTPAGITAGAPPGVTEAIGATEAPPVPQPESPGQAATASGQGIGALVGAGGPLPGVGGPLPAVGRTTVPAAPVPAGVTPPPVLTGAGAPAIDPSAPGRLIVPGAILPPINDPPVNDPPVLP
jgi:FecR protein